MLYKIIQTHYCHVNEIKNTIYISYSAPISQPEAKTIYITKPKIKHNTSHIGIKMIKQLTIQFSTHEVINYLMEN